MKPFAIRRDRITVATPGGVETPATSCALVQELTASLGIGLLFLPSYSPNLNLIERLWRFLRQQVLDSTYCEQFDQFTTGIHRGVHRGDRTS